MLVGGVVLVSIDCVGLWLMLMSSVYMLKFECF